MGVCGSPSSSGAFAEGSWGSASGPSRVRSPVERPSDRRSGAKRCTESELGCRFRRIEMGGCGREAPYQRAPAPRAQRQLPNVHGSPVSLWPVMCDFDGPLVAQPYVMRLGRYVAAPGIIGGLGAAFG